MRKLIVDFATLMRFPGSAKAVHHWLCTSYLSAVSVVHAFQRLHLLTCNRRYKRRIQCDAYATKAFPSMERKLGLAALPDKMSHFDRSSAHLSNEHGRQTFASELLHAPSGETDGNNSTCSSKEQLYTQPKGDDYPLPARKSNHPYGKSQKLGLSSNYCTQVKRDIEKAGHGTIRQQSQCQRRVYKWMNYVCFPCCCCSTPMWLRSVGCILLLAVAVFGVVVGILAASYRAPSLDMNGVTVDPTGLPLFSRVNDTSFDLNLGLQFVGRNPNMEPVMFASIGVKAYYPTAPKWLLASSSMENVVIKGSGMTNFTYPIHIHYDMAGDTDKAVLKDIASKCEHGKLSFHTDISMVIEILDVYIPIPTFRKTVMFDCPNELKEVSRTRFA